jgi:hypothetical protein
VVRKKKAQQTQEVPIDKVEDFMLHNYKKIVMVAGALLLVFIVGYTVRQILAGKAEMMNERVSQAEAELSISPTPENIENFKNLAIQDSGVKNYIYLKAGIVEANTDKKTAIETLNGVGGSMGEFADGLAFDLGNKNIDPKKYFTTGAAKPLWYYRAVLAAEGDEKQKLIEEFGTKYPESPLYEIVKRWNS